MVAELREMGNELALYTDDNRLYRRFSGWSCTIFKVPYTQGGKLIAVDIYFDRKFKSTVSRVINGQLVLNI